MVNKKEYSFINSPKIKHESQFYRIRAPYPTTKMVRRKSIRDNDRAEEVIDADDRISRLPVELIHHIYSFIDTRFAVQSSLLSRRWRNTWKSHPYLNFKIETDPYTYLTIGSKFPSFVHRFLSAREKDAELPTIDFRSNSIKLSLLKEIISYAISHRTQKLNIEYLSGIPTRRGGFDLSLFKSEYLQELSLNIDVKFLKTPTLTWDLPALTTLHLERVTFSLYSPNNDGDSSSTSKSLELFSTLSNLKTLVLVHCRLWDIHTFCITSSRLENLTFERVLHHSCQFLISAPKLLSFTYNHMAPCSLLANDLDSLETVNFRALDRDRSMEEHFKLVELMINTFDQLYKAKFLTLNTNAVLCLSRFPEFLKRRGCPFVRLQSLTLDETPPLSIKLFDIISYFRGSSGGMFTIRHNPTPSTSDYMGCSEQVIIRFS